MACGVVAVAELLDMVVFQRTLDLGGEVKRELQFLRGRALPDGLANLRIGDLRIEEDFEQFAEQHDRGVRAVGDVELERDQRPAGLACWMPTPSSKRSMISSVILAASAQNASIAG